MPRITTANRLDRGRKAINNTLRDTSIQNAVLAYGYDAAELGAGSALLATAESAVTTALQREIEQKRVTKAATDAEALARKWEADYITDARAIFLRLPAPLPSS
jgi:hypothetical protein